MKPPVLVKYLTIITVLLMAAAPAYSEEQVHTVILMVHSAEDPARGTHVFDGAVIEARRVEDGERVDVQTANRNGQVIFKLPAGMYLFGPAEGIERRLQGERRLSVTSNLETHLELSVK